MRAVQSSGKSVVRALDEVVRPVYRGLKGMGWKYFKVDALRHLRHEGYNAHAGHFARRKADRAFAVLVDGRKVGEQRISRRSPQEMEEFFDVVSSIPAETVAGKRKVTVRFEGIEGREKGAVYGIRVIRF